MALVSIVVPVYNNEKYVEKCIGSLLEQTYSELELIVIDDGSKDESLEILRRFEQKDKRIKLIHQENAGVAAARNCGIKAATGEYLTFVDGDDYVSIDYVEKFVSCIESNQADMVICGISYVDEKNNLLKEILPNDYIKGEREECTFRISAVCSHFYRREIWTKHNIYFYSGERGEDLPISLFFSVACDKIATLSEPGYFYVQHASSARHNFKGLNNYKLPYCALEEMLKKIESMGICSSTEFYEVFVLRILATFFFDLGRGATRENMRILCDYIVRILDTYFPLYYKNRLARLFTKLCVPFSQKVAVWLLVRLTKTRMIYPVSVLLGFI